VNDCDVVLEGAGRIDWGVDEEGNIMKTEHKQITVFASGLVLFRLDDGTVSAGSSLALSVFIPKPTWTVLDMPRTMPEPPPSCPRCNDDPAARARMMPPVCPKCGRGA
jgi:hypothetical protein